MPSKNSLKSLDPDEIFLDSSNLPSFEVERFEGRIEHALSKRSVGLVGLVFILIGLGFFSRVGYLQVARGEEYRERSNSNHLREINVYADRGLIYDRNDELLAWNDPGGIRRYIREGGFAHVLGYLGLPTKDDTGINLDEKLGKAGVEKMSNSILQGEAGLKIEEVNARGEVTSESVEHPPAPGESLKLSIDSRLQARLSSQIKEIAQARGFTGGSGVLVDVNTGEILVLTSYPEYDPEVLSLGSDNEAITKILGDKNTPFLDRATEGLYTPGSIIKPYMALAALQEKIITPEHEIESTGSISIPNPYDPDTVSVFKDNKAHGFVNMRDALSVSSNVYFYELGGGYKDQKGLGISRIEKYVSMFGFGTTTNLFSSQEPAGTIPSPKWKAKMFDGEPWRIGDTYHTSIGQYGYQVTPLQMAMAISVVANGGVLRKASIFMYDEHRASVHYTLPIDASHYKVVREGMRQGVTSPKGTAKALSIPGLAIAAKTGTAELDAAKLYVNSWVTGFFPFENPKYAFAVIMEHGPSNNIVGAGAAMRGLLEWMQIYTPEYLTSNP